VRRTQEEREELTIDSLTLLAAFLLPIVVALILEPVALSLFRLEDTSESERWVAERARGRDSSGRRILES